MVISRRTLAAGLLAAWATFAPPVGACAQTGSAGPVRIAVLDDMSGLFADMTGPGGALAVRMAVEDFGGTVLGRPVEVVLGDHQNKADIGAALAREWYDRGGVEMIVGLGNSAVALAVQQITREKNRVNIVSGAGSTELTGRACSPNGAQWTYDTYSVAKSTASALMAKGDDSWFLLTADYAFGHSLEENVKRFVTASGGKVLGSARHPLNSSDLSSFLLQAQASGAKVVGLANSGGDTINAVKQATEFGMPKGGAKLAGLLVQITDIHSLGLEMAQGFVFTEAFYWDLDEGTRAWARRFMERHGKAPTMSQAGMYSGTSHYLKSAQAAGTLEAAAVMKKMRELPIEDMMTHNGRLRADGRVVRDMYLFEVKRPSESKGPWDLYKLVSRIPGETAFRPISESECPLVRK